MCGGCAFILVRTRAFDSGAARRLRVANPSSKWWVYLIGWLERRTADVQGDYSRPPSPGWPSPGLFGAFDRRGAMVVEVMVGVVVVAVVVVVVVG
jgi:hypothetical protein